MPKLPPWEIRCDAVSRHIVSPMRLSGGVNKSIPQMESTGIEYSPLKLKLDIKHKMLMLNTLQCQYIVSGCCCGPIRHIYAGVRMKQTPRLKFLPSPGFEPWTCMSI